MLIFLCSLMGFTDVSYCWVLQGNPMLENFALSVGTVNAVISAANPDSVFITF